MISVDEALKIVLHTAPVLETEMVELQMSIGRITSKDWFSDRDMPAYDRVMMDGIAIQFDRFSQSNQFPVEGIAAAGMPQKTLSEWNQCIEVMTGCVLPLNTDTVIRYEDVKIANESATITIDCIKKGQNVHPRATDRKKGALLVPAGTKITSAEIAIAATIGKTEVEVQVLPSVMVISTGDELVEINRTPLAHQIRKSNVYQIQAVFMELGILADSDHLSDEMEEIRAKLKRYLDDYDLIVLSGGVSKGKFDFLPTVLAELGVEKLFHRVKQRPGKPFWFGRKANSVVFALPGNPVSSYMCTQLYIRKWLEKLVMKQRRYSEFAILDQDVLFKPDIDYFVQVRLESRIDGTLHAVVVNGNGSGDLANLADADAFLHLPKGENVYLAGKAYPILRFR